MPCASLPGRLDGRDGLAGPGHFRLEHSGKFRSHVSEFWGRNEIVPLVRIDLKIVEKAFLINKVARMVLLGPRPVHAGHRYCVLLLPRAQGSAGQALTDLGKDAIAEDFFPNGFLQVDTLPVGGNLAASGR